MPTVQKNTELHRHLDASMRASTLAELITRFNVAAPYRTEKDVKERFWLTRQMGSLQEVLDCFSLFQNVLRTPDVLERVGREAVEDAHAEGIEWLELRYSPAFTSGVSGISWNEALAAFWRGLEQGARATAVKVGLLCIASRDFGVEAARRTIDFAIENRERFIGVDLAGPETGYPCRQFKDVFRKASDAGLRITVHAGEAEGPENVWEAIDELGASRIGHGIRSIEDPVLIRRLARDGILLETCPTSNFITRSVARWQDHPLPRLLEAGVPVSVSTDDPGIFGVPLPEEFERCKRYLGVSDADLQRIREYARLHSFLQA